MSKQHMQQQQQQQIPETALKPGLLWESVGRPKHIETEQPLRIPKKESDLLNKFCRKDCKSKICHQESNNCVYSKRE